MSSSPCYVGHIDCQLGCDQRHIETIKKQQPALDRVLAAARALAVFSCRADAAVSTGMQHQLIALNKAVEAFDRCQCD